MSEKTKKKSKRSLTGWLIEFAEEKKLNYILCMLFAISKVVCGLVPYIYMADIVKTLLILHRSGEVPKMGDFSRDMIMMGVFWVLSKVSHAISTTISHATSFVILANIRRRLAEKLAKIPLGSVMADSSGTYKNIICERVDSIETTLAHIIPEVGAGILVPVALIIYMLTINVKLNHFFSFCQSNTIINKVSCNIRNSLILIRSNELFLRYAITWRSIYNFFGFTCCNSKCTYAE